MKLRLRLVLNTSGCWLQSIIEPTNKQILHIEISFERTTMLIVAERFIASLINKFGKHPVSTDGGTWYPLQACQFLKLKHHLHSPLEKSLIERTIQYIKKIEQNVLMITFHVKEKRNVN